MDKQKAEAMRQRPGEDEWAWTRRIAFSDVRPPEWPEHVHAISSRGVALLGVHDKTGELHWDGKPIALRPPIRLGTFERWAAALATLGTLGTFVVEVGRSAGWWGG